MGKVLQPQNAHAIVAGTAHGGSPAAGAEPATAESLGWQLREALPPLRLHSVSIYDNEGNVRWLSEGALGPDEHALVIEALETLGAATAKSCCENRLEDGRIAVSLPVRAPQGHLVGLAMILADLKASGEGLIERIMTPPLRTVMQKLAVLLRPVGPRKPDADPTGLVLSLAAETAVTAEPTATVPPAAPPVAEAPKSPPARAADDELSPRAVNDILEFEITAAPLAAAPRPASPPRAGTPPAPPPTASAATGSVRAPSPASSADTGGSPSIASAATTSSARTLSLDPALVTLDMLPFVKLRSGGRTRRFEVLPSGAARELRDPATLDALAMERLLSWLGTHRAAWTLEPTSFTLSLSIATLEDDRFPRRLAAGLSGNGIHPDTVGFEIAEPLCTQRRAQVERFLTACEKLGCFAVIDDFSFDSAVLPLLRSKAVRLVKIDSRLTRGALRDKLSQALVIATVQAAKVLGIHCAAQQVDSQAGLQWLTAVGCDFAQGPMLARQQALAGLLEAATEA